MLLVIPQITVWTYMLVWLIDDRGWSTTAAGALVGSTQLLGAAARIGVGWWSDRVGSRLGPMRVVAVATLGDHGRPSACSRRPASRSPS